MITKQFNPAISIIRVLAMFSIIVGHWLTMKGINHYQFGSIGVQIFLFISGWLQSGKNISDTKYWLFDKWKRICAPFYIVLAIVVVLRLLCGFSVQKNALIVMLLNLQGTSKILQNISIPVIQGYGHTWFITVLALCYLLTLVLKRHPRIESQIKTNTLLSFLIVLLVQILLAFGYIQIGGIICYFLGYFWNHDKPSSIKMYRSLTVSMILITILRFFVYIFFDGTQLYDGIVFTWSFNVLGIWIVITMMLICNKYRECSMHIATSRIWQFLDLASYPLFLSHYMFVKGELSVNGWLSSALSQVVVFTVLTFVIALIVLVICDFEKLKQLCCKTKQKISN